MPDSFRIYLDNAATSYPKPEAVWNAVDRYNRTLGVPVGRGAYRQSSEVQQVVDRCRKRAADLLHAESPDRIVFTFNGTDSLNMALHGLMSEGDHVVTSAVEHNSVLRPLRELQHRRGVELSLVEADSTGLIDPDEIRKALKPSTKLVSLIHASNVSGAIQPVEEVGRLARKAGAFFCIDAAQTAGHIPIDVQQLSVDLLACSGHKGLLGPLGTGLLYVRPGIEEHLPSFRQGGTGSRSEEDRQPDSLPDKYESGNHNAPGLFGLEAGMDYLQEKTVEALRGHELELTGRLLEGLKSLSEVRISGPTSLEQRVGVVSVTVAGFEPQILAAILDENFSIQTRAGLHCAPGVHRCLGTFNAGGAVRFSIGPFNTVEDINMTVDALREVGGAV